VVYGSIGDTDMSERVNSYLEERAWLFHRGKWIRIKNPIYRRELVDAPAPPGRQTFRKVLGKYNVRCWILGPDFLFPYYTGTLVFAYRRDVEGEGPEYLIWIDTIKLVSIIFAQDLPDLLSVLALLAPSIHIDVLVDVYKRGMNAYKENQNNT
jgi:hypothetical protein